MAMTLADIRDLYNSSPTLANRLNLNQIEAVCECGTFLFWDQFTGALAHVGACTECYDPRTCEGDTEACDRPHGCGEVNPVTCEHGGCGEQAAPHETEGICIDDLARCGGCCQPPDYDPNDL